MTKYHVYDKYPGSDGMTIAGHAGGIYEADNRTGARLAFMAEWEYEKEYWFTTRLSIRKWHDCETCGGTGVIPYPEGYPEYEYEEFGLMCPDCLCPENRDAFNRLQEWITAQEYEPPLMDFGGDDK